MYIDTFLAVPISNLFNNILKIKSCMYYVSMSHIYYQLNIINQSKIYCTGIFICIEIVAKTTDKSPVIWCFHLLLFGTVVCKQKLRKWRLQHI